MTRLRKKLIRSFVQIDQNYMLRWPVPFSEEQESSLDEHLQSFEPQPQELPFFENIAMIRLIPK